MSDTQQQIEFASFTDPPVRAIDPPASQASAKEIEPKIAGLVREFIDALGGLGVASTAAEIARAAVDRSGRAHPAETYRKRAAEAVKTGRVERLAVVTRTCKVTGKKAHLYQIVQR
jgi:hypothetical protein